MTINSEHWFEDTPYNPPKRVSKTHGYSHRGYETILLLVLWPAARVIARPSVDQRVPESSCTQRDRQWIEDQAHFQHYSFWLSYDPPYISSSRTIYICGTHSCESALIGRLDSDPCAASRKELSTDFTSEFEMHYTFNYKMIPHDELSWELIRWYWDMVLSILILALIRVDWMRTGQSGRSSDWCWMLTIISLVIEDQSTELYSLSIGIRFMGMKLNEDT